MLATQQELQTFNSFGIITITPKKIIVAITAIAGKLPIKRSVSKELQKPLPEVGDRTVAAAFGAYLSSGHKARVTVSEVATTSMKMPLADIPEVDRLLHQAVQLVEQSAFHS